MFTSTRIDLDNLDAYVYEITDAFEKRTQEFVEKVEQKAKSMPVDERDEWYEWNSEHHWILTEVFPGIYKNSLFITIHAYLESTLAQLCKILEEDNAKLKKLKDLTGNGIELYQEYIKIVQEIDFPDQSREWNQISIYRKVRNFLVHQDGRLDDSKNAKNIRQFANRKPEFLTIDKNNQIVLSTACHLDFINTIRKFFDKFYKQFS